MKHDLFSREGIIHVIEITAKVPFNVQLSYKIALFFTMRYNEVLILDVDFDVQYIYVATLSFSSISKNFSY